MAITEIKSSAGKRQDGRQAMTVYLRSELVEKLKMRSLKEKRHAYLIIEEMIDEAFDKV